MTGECTKDIFLHLVYRSKGAGTVPALFDYGAGEGTKDIFFHLVYRVQRDYLDKFNVFELRTYISSYVACLYL
jgi:hypothetical protein